MGTRVSIIFVGMTRMTGFTVGPPTGTRGSVDRSGPPSMGSPDPRKIRPRMFGEYTTSSGRPRNWTVASVDRPLPPAKTCRLTRFRSRPMTLARDVSPSVFSTSAMSPSATPEAYRRMTSPTISCTRV